jgi:hypothetical protein
MLKGRRQYQPETAKEQRISRCYPAITGVKNPGFPRLSPNRPLYFPGIYSENSKGPESR